jgi:predicted ABC-type ATPase
MNRPELWVIVGGNGAGKSTFFRTLLEPLGIPFINADLIAKEIAPENPEAASYDAAELAAQQRKQAVKELQNFCYETVFSHSSKIDFLAEAKALDYEINLVVIYVSDKEINKARVGQRVSEGGHNVPEDKIESRIPRTHKNIGLAVELCDSIYVFDNSSYDNPFRRVATKEKNNVTFHEAHTPDWVIKLFDYLLPLNSHTNLRDL